MTKKKKIILTCVSSMLAIVLIVTTIFLATRTPEKEEKPENSHPVSSDVTVEIPKVDDTPSIQNPDKPKDTELTVDVDDGKSTIDEKIPAEKEDKPITEVKPNPPKEPDNGGGSTDVNPPEDNKYNCGVSGHKCINAENHAYISNLEVTGCEYCGSKCCVSFYYVNAAGIPVCNPTLCPKYNSKNDPTKTCQDCGKPMGTGNNGTCEKYLVDGSCPSCGADVKAHTCHSH